MDIVFYMLKVIYNDLIIVGVFFWSYWILMDIFCWGYKNCFLLILLEFFDGVYGDIEKEGIYKVIFIFWVLGNYSLFIWLGYCCIMFNMNELFSFFGLVWILLKKDKIVVVYINLLEKGVWLNEIYKEWVSEISFIIIYIIINNKNL